MKVLFFAYLAVCLFYWIRVAWCVWRLRILPDLARLSPPEPQPFPKLSVVVPARNEADTIEPAARTILAEGLPGMEVVLIDDRSEDGTGAIIDRLAAEDSRVKAIHVAELPAGWLGKVHALQTGFRATSGDLVLFTDADVHFQPGTLRKAAACCEEKGLDHLVALPSIWPAGLLLNSVVAAFLRHLLTALDPVEVSDPESKAFFGVGAFNLVRRSAFEKTEGFEWLRMETADDMGMGLLMKSSGMKCAVVTALDLVGLHWHRNLRELLRGSEKAYAAAAGCRIAPMIALGLAFLALELSPLLGFLTQFFDFLEGGGLLGSAVFLLFAADAVLLARWARARPLPALLAPLTAPLTAWIWLRAAWLGWKRGGIVWRGTLYPSAALREGRRVRIF